MYMSETVTDAFADGDIKIIPLLPCESNYIFEVLLNVVRTFMSLIVTLYELLINKLYFVSFWQFFFKFQSIQWLEIT